MVYFSRVQWWIKTKNRKSSSNTLHFITNSPVYWSNWRRARKSWEVCYKICNKGIKTGPALITKLLTGTLLDNDTIFLLQPKKYGSVAGTNKYGDSFNNKFSIFCCSSDKRKTTNFKICSNIKNFLHKTKQLRWLWPFTTMGIHAFYAVSVEIRNSR